MRKSKSKWEKREIRGKREGENKADKEGRGKEKEEMEEGGKEKKREKEEGI